MIFTLTKTVKTETDQSDWKYEYRDRLDEVSGALTRDGVSWIHEVHFTTVDTRVPALCAKIHKEALRLYHSKKRMRKGEVMALHALCGFFQQ